MTAKVKPPTVIVSGMHRSGTSLVASLLAALSLDLGDELLPADSHNQPGYFEDVAFLSFHQRVLSQLCVPDERGHSDWGWTESERLDVSRFSEFRAQAQRLLNDRTHDEAPWGWKDPRTTLFLDFWDSLLEEARYVFVYRFPWDVADSMQRLGAEVFLKNPEYAYQIWAFYNQRLHDFYVEHSDRCLLVSINALQKNLERFVFLLGDKLGLPTRDSDIEEVFKDHLFKSIGGQDPLIDLVANAWPDCARLLSELDQLADISSAALWQARPVRSRLSRPDGLDNGPVDVSVVTPCYEQGTLLLEAIASAERHAPPRCELIIVNDGSRHPRTLAILESLKRSGYFVIDQENAGLSAARNKAIQLARGRYILPLDDDNRIREGFIAESVSALDSSPEVGIVYGDRYEFGLRTGIEQMAEFDLDALLESNYIDACAVFRKQVWIDCQGYDPLMCPLDDWELWIHAAARGWRFHHISRGTFDYRVRPDSLISQNHSAEKDEDFRKRIRAKHSELYWAKSVKEVEAIKRLLAEQTDRQNRLDVERHILESRLEIARSQVAEMDRDIAAKDQEISGAANDRQVVSLEIALKEQELQTLSIQLAERDARIERMISSLGWRLLSRYGRFKYRYLLPIYRLFGQIPVKRSESTSMAVSAAHDATEVAREQSGPPAGNNGKELDPHFEVKASQQKQDSPATLQGNGFEQGSPIFYHRPHGEPVHGITEGVIQGFTKLSEVIIENPGRRLFSKPGNLTLITYNNYKRKVLIEKCYEAYGINDFVVLGQEIAQWDWASKIRPILDYLESGECLSEYIVATDSDDVLMVNNPASIIDLFESYSCDALFCNTFVDYPANKQYRDFETLKYYTHPLHCHLSAGGYIGRRGALIQFLREIISAYEKKNHWAIDGVVFNDQLAWRHLHYNYYPRIKIDFKSLIFKRYDLFVTCD